MLLASQASLPFSPWPCGSPFLLFRGLCWVPPPPSPFLALMAHFPPLGPPPSHPDEAFCSSSLLVALTGLFLGCKVLKEGLKLPLLPGVPETSSPWGGAPGSDPLKWWRLWPPAGRSPAPPYSYGAVRLSWASASCTRARFCRRFGSFLATRSFSAN